VDVEDVLNRREHEEGGRQLRRARSDRGNVFIVAGLYNDKNGQQGSTTNKD